MKKLLVLLFSALIIAGSLAACSSGEGSKGPSSEDQSGNPKQAVAEQATSPWQQTTITTDTAKIKEMDACNLIMSYSAKELSLTEKQKSKCSFMVTGTGVEIEGDFYIEVDAVIKHEQKDDKGETYYTFDNKGEYFIRYDGKQILKKDMTAKKDKYTEMKVREVPKN